MENSIKGHPAFIAFTAGASKADTVPANAGDSGAKQASESEDDAEKTAGIFKGLKNDPEKDAALAAMMAAGDKNSPDFDEAKAKELSDAFNAKYGPK